MGMSRLVAVLVALGTPVSAADVSFCWIGNSGYSMVGQMAIQPAAMSKRIVTEADITQFEIIGYHDGQMLGRWDIGQLSAGGTWHLRFDTIQQQFLTGGSFPTQASQGWNADGAVRNCGIDGFGFNSGNAGQDICVNGEYIADSTVPPDTPFFAGDMARYAGCGRPLMLSGINRLTANHPSG